MNTVKKTTITAKKIMTTKGKKLAAGLLVLLSNATLMAPVVAQQVQTDEADETIEMPVEMPVEEPVNDPVNDPMSFLQAPFRQQQFVPDISLILDMGVGAYSLPDAQRQALISPYALQQQVDFHHAVNANTGFNLNYAELTLSAPVDPYLELFSTFHLSAFEFEIEEAYIRSRGLPLNTELVAGKFLSHFGRLNAQHAHFWSFNDKPLVYDHFFGSENLNELGARLSWLAPTDFFLDLGLEVLQGKNSASFGQAGFVSGDQELLAVNLPNLLVATAKTSFDAFDALTVLGGLSYARGGSRFVPPDAAGLVEHNGHFHAAQAAAEPVEALTTYVGATQILGADLSLRWFVDSYRDLSWQSEVLLRQSQGNRYAEGLATPTSFLQLGGYSQVLWRFAQQWRAGVRADVMGLNERREGDLNIASAARLPQTRYSTMVEYLPSEFTRLRLQYNLDATGFDHMAQAAPVHGLFFNLNVVMGAHGAHEF